MKLSLQKYVFQNKITNMEYIGKRVLNHVNSDSTITIITDGSPAKLALFCMSGKRLLGCFG